MSVLDDLSELAAEQDEGQDRSEWVGTIIQHLALAAQVVGIDLSDDTKIKEFLAEVRNVVTKDKAQLLSQLRRWTAGKARTAVRSTKGAL